MPITLAPPAAVFVATLLLVDLLIFTPAFSWFDKGHRVVASIAQAYLTSEARRQIKKILPANTTLADASVWPDHQGRSIRDFEPLHYINNIPTTPTITWNVAPDRPY